VKSGGSAVGGYNVDGVAMLTSEDRLWPRGLKKAERILLEPMRTPRELAIGHDGQAAHERKAGMTWQRTHLQ
jgi:hypothetical protein